MTEKRGVSDDFLRTVTEAVESMSLPELQHFRHNVLDHQCAVYGYIPADATLDDKQRVMRAANRAFRHVEEADNLSMIADPIFVDIGEYTNGVFRPAFTRLMQLVERDKVTMILYLGTFDTLFPNYTNAQRETIKRRIDRLGALGKHLVPKQK